MGLYKQGEIYYYDFTVDGRRYAGSTGQKQKSLAQKVYDELKAQRRGEYSIRQVWEQTRRSLGKVGNGVAFTTESIWKHFIGKAMPQACEKRLRLYRNQVGAFVEWAEGRCRKVSDVTPSIATEYISYIRSQPGASATKNENLATLKMVFASFGEDQGVMENPFGGISKMKHDQESREVFTPEELRLIGTNAKGWIYDLCLTAVSTGLREGDICNLKWASVSSDLRWIHVSVSKTGKELDIPVMKGLRELLSSLDRKGEYVFPELHTMKERCESEIGHGVKNFLESIGISGAVKERDGYKRAVSVKDVHSLRHTFVYLAAINGMPFPVVQGIVGHASPAMTKIYMDHASMRDRERFLSAIPQYMIGEGKNKAPTIQDIIGMVEADAPKESILGALRSLL